MKLFKTLKLVLTADCSQITRLESEALERGLSRGERWASALHRVSCKGCRAFRKQMALLREVGQSAKGRVAPGLSGEARQRISEALRDATK